MDSTGETSNTIPNPIIDLEVGRGNYYSIRRDSLSKFRFFRKLMPINPTFVQKLSIDANQDIFPHIVAYLRRGTYPIVIDAKGRHDVPTYLALLEEAKYFQLDRLTDWLEHGRWADAAKVEYMTTTRGEAELDGVARFETLPTTHDSHGRITATISEECFPAWGKKLLYRCPRGFHDGDRTGCGRKCHNALGDAPPSYDEVPMLRLLEVRKQLVIDQRLCRDPDW